MLGSVTSSDFLFDEEEEPRTKQTHMWLDKYSEDLGLADIDDDDLPPTEGDDILDDSPLTDDSKEVKLSKEMEGVVRS